MDQTAKNCKKSPLFQGSFPTEDFQKLLPLAFTEDLVPTHSPTSTPSLSRNILTGDITSQATIRSEQISKAKFIAKEPGILAGLDGILETFRFVDADMEQWSWEFSHSEGDFVEKNTCFLTVTAPTQLILVCERIALNFLQRACGIATFTHQVVQALEGSPTQILDTRKTLPGYRSLDKYAVLVGGGSNHRVGLYDRVLIKDNHIRAAGSVQKAVEKAEQIWGSQYLIEAEVTSIKELNTLLGSAVNWIMLDNMSNQDMQEAVSITQKYNKTSNNVSPIKLEASGNMTVERIQEIKHLGLDAISMGSLTHSVQALDISLLFEDLV
jgi:nicotinate-nucleotide pyrophosphorylase (carboxylating)